MHEQHIHVFADATVYVGSLDDKVSEAILWELFLQAGPVGKWMKSCRNPFNKRESYTVLPMF